MVMMMLFILWLFQCWVTIYKKNNISITSVKDSEISDILRSKISFNDCILVWADPALNSLQEM